MMTRVGRRHWSWRPSPSWSSRTGRRATDTWSARRSVLQPHAGTLPESMAETLRSTALR